MTLAGEKSATAFARICGASQWVSWDAFSEGQLVTIVAQLCRQFKPNFQSRAIKRHGRLETHVLVKSALLNQYLDWPGAYQIL
jgi:hypothetical protein